MKISPENIYFWTWHSLQAFVFVSLFAPTIAFELVLLISILQKKP